MHLTSRNKKGFVFKCLNYNVVLFSLVGLAGYVYLNILDYMFMIVFLISFLFVV